MTPLAEVLRIAELYEMTVIPCAAPFLAHWVTKNDEDLLFVSPDLDGSDLDAIEKWLEEKRGPRMQFVGSVSAIRLSNGRLRAKA